MVLSMKVGFLKASNYLITFVNCVQNNYLNRISSKVPKGSLWGWLCKRLSTGKLSAFTTCDQSHCCKQKTTGHLEIRTSQLTLRLVRKPYQGDGATAAGGETVWQDGDERIVLPDQLEIARTEEDALGDATIEVSMVSYKKMQVWHTLSLTVCVAWDFGVVKQQNLISKKESRT